MSGLHKVIGEIEGFPYPASWAEPGHWSRIQVCTEVHEGDRLAYVAGLTEDGISVRVDLGRDGWQDLRDLAEQVVNRIDAADAEDAQP